MESAQQRLVRREWWLWFCALVVTTLSGTAFLLSSFPSLFPQSSQYFEIRPDQARWGILNLLLLFNSWVVYRQWSFRRMRRRLTEPGEDAHASLKDAGDLSHMDPVTSLYTRVSGEQWLGKEVARARRQKLDLSLVAFHLDDFAELNRRYGGAAGDLFLKEFANHLRKASRGTDFVVRLGIDDFVLVLPECNLRDAKNVSDRLGTPAVNWSGQDIALTYSAGWIDYRPGEAPSDLFKRAENVLQLYEKASKYSLSTTPMDR